MLCEVSETQIARPNKKGAKIKIDVERRQEGLFGEMIHPVDETLMIEETTGGERRVIGEFLDPKGAWMINSPSKKRIIENH